MKVLFASSEALPYFKSGGLADVARALPDALTLRGHDVRIIHPMYGSVVDLNLPLVEADRLTVPWVGGDIDLRMFTHRPAAGAPGVLVYHDAFATSTPYESPDPLAPARRFALFSRAVLGYARAWGADIVHLNDWQTGLVPVYALLDGVSLPSVFAIHNLGYQGLFPPRVLGEVGVPPEFFRPENGLEFYGNVALIKGGIGLADRVVTVSPSYAREIQTPEYGVGLDGLLRFRDRVLHGILNGIDQDAWNPATDIALYHSYSSADLAGKEANRTQLLHELGLRADGPLFVVVSRLAYQKGIDLVLQALPALLDENATVVILGDGDHALEAQFGELARRLPDRIAAFLRFDDTLARRLYAAADFFLMPSRYEPCGLGQMIAQRYGTPPIVRATGGLRDTVVDGETGFLFHDTSPYALLDAVRRALAVWRQPGWDTLRQRCMALDWSWQQSAGQYEDVYRYAIGPVAS